MYDIHFFKNCSKLKKKITFYNHHFEKINSIEKELEKIRNERASYLQH